MWMLQMNQVMKLWMAEYSTSYVEQSYEFMRWLSNEFVWSCKFKYDLLCVNDVRVRSIAFSNNQMFLYDSHCGNLYELASKTFPICCEFRLELFT